jgi:chromate transport protein ChrA
VLILRGTARILAAATGLLLVYRITFALEGMTTRIPTAAAWELATRALWTMPWLLLFCSGLEDVAVVTSKPWVVWFGGIVALFLYYVAVLRDQSAMPRLPWVQE